MHGTRTLSSEQGFTWDPGTHLPEVLPLAGISCRTELQDLAEMFRAVFVLLPWEEVPYGDQDCIVW